MRPALISLILVCLISGCGPDLSTHIRTGENARSRILSSGITLPTSASDLYYAFQPQFSDHLDTWISFTASPSDCSIVAQQLARVRMPSPAFVPGTRSRRDAVTGGPGYHHPEFATPHWDLSAVKNGTMFETNDLFVLMDKDTNRIYISFRSP